MDDGTFFGSDKDKFGVSSFPILLLGKIFVNEVRIGENGLSIEVWIKCLLYKGRRVSEQRRLSYKWLY